MSLQDIGRLTCSVEKATAGCKVLVATTQAGFECQTVNLSGHVSEQGADLARLKKALSTFRQQGNQTLAQLGSSAVRKWSSGVMP